jgi:hypothetical protein
VLLDARADVEQWAWALRLLTPLCSALEEVGSPELTTVMHGALLEAEGEHARAHDALEAIRGGLEAIGGSSEG